MYDYLMEFLTEANAKRALTEFMDTQTPAQWRTDVTIPNCKCWTKSQDVNGVHTYWPNWHILVTTPGQRDDLTQKVTTVFVAERSGAVKGDLGAVLKCNYPDPTDIGIEPLFAGMRGTLSNIGAVPPHVVPTSFQFP